MNYLQNFIKSHSDWENILTHKPYSLVVKRDEGYILFKYNQFDSDMSLPECREARGIIFREKDWTCVCRAFDRFFNYGEEYAASIDWYNCTVQEKLDGSLIKIWYDGELHISTNGTIDAFKADMSDYNESYGSYVLDILMQKMNQGQLNRFKEYPDRTFMFELVAPLGHPVAYAPDLVFLGSRNSVTGQEYNVEDTEWMFSFFKTPKLYNVHTLLDAVALAETFKGDCEGFVVCDKNFNRIKIKSPEYLKLHYLRSELSQKQLLRYVLEGGADEILSYFPRYTDSIRKIEAGIKLIIAGFDEVATMVDNHKDMTEKDFFGYISEELDKRHVAFAMMRFRYGKSVEEYVKTIPFYSWKKWLDI